MLLTVSGLRVFAHSSRETTGPGDRRAREPGSTAIALSGASTDGQGDGPGPDLFYISASDLRIGDQKGEATVTI